MLMPVVATMSEVGRARSGAAAPNFPLADPEAPLLKANGRLDSGLLMPQLKTRAVVPEKHENAHQFGKPGGCKCLSKREEARLSMALN